MTHMIKKEEIEKLAELGRIEVTEDEKEKLMEDIESILGYVSEIQEVVLDIPKSEAGSLRNVMRDDGYPHESGKYTDRILKEAPKTEDNYLKVKKILNQD